MSDIERPTDADLVAAYRTGDADAFAEIYDRYSAEVFSHFLAAGRSRQEAADDANDAFLEAAERLDVSDMPGELGPWLLGIAGSRSGDPDPSMPGNLDPAPPALRARVLDQVEREVASAFSRVVDPEWAKIGLFALVTVVVGLLGLAVSAQFDPLPPASTVPAAEEPPVAGSSTTTTTTITTAVSSSSTTVSGSTSSTTAGTPAAIEASTDTVNLGGDGTVGEFELTNTGGRPGEWALVSSSDAIEVSAGSGEIEAGETITIDLSLDREMIEEGDISEVLTVSWAGGQIPVAVVGTHEANPIIHNPQATPASVEVSGSPDCVNTETTISARIRDASPLESVVVRWSPDGGNERETPMSAVGNEMFEGVVGPFTEVHTASVRIVAIDDRGNAGGATTAVAVVACP